MVKKQYNIFPPLTAKYNFRTVYYDIYNIVYSNGRYNILGSDKDFATFEDAYDYVSDVLGGVANFDGNNIKKSNSKIYSNFYGFVSNKKTGRMFPSISNDAFKNLESDYNYFKKINRKYLRNKNNFYYAYQFLTHHPIFWSLSGDLAKSKMLFWNTNEGLEAMWHTVYRDKKGKVQHMLEHGPYLEAEETILGKKVNVPSRLPAHDFRLDVIARTYESAIIKLAKRVNKFYLPNGEGRQG